MSTTTDDSFTVDSDAVKKAVTAAGMGNALEWFDFSVYAYMAGTVGKVFFPSHSDSASLLSALAVFAVAFLVRPLGGLFFGPLGDKIGRSKVLATTIIMMSAGTFVVGLLPSFATIGLWAPILLIAARLVQGFSTGGEYGGAATFICEYSPDDRRGFLASFLEFGTLAGYSLGAIVVLGTQLGMGDAAFADWGWRIPFLIAAPLGLFGLYLRLKLEDSPAFEQVKESGEADGSLAEVVTSHMRQLLLCIGLVIILNVAYYTVLTYLPSYLESVLNMSSLESTGLLVITMIVMMCVIFLFGGLSDTVGRKPVLIGTCIGFILLSYPAFWLMGTTTVAGVVVALAILGLLTVSLAGTMPATLPAIFPTRVRYGGFAIAYNISTSLFGGTAPYLIQWLIGETGSKMVPAFYLMAAAAVALVPIMLIPETARRPLPGSKAQYSGRGGPAREPAPAA
ncbi:MFS transporter [Salinisphaera sp. Q1T1-3]|uniref:MFS transporter n=1 Tax=Salinisphaera sp. Q1T1-3 TaxID=2321229 RepID=UPI000E758AC7|nr:MFS transporter [Salinisphaera sp. Q1T1-3]RJS91409.1 MFS transporter [Salinisphaera sp. Q1T1-3]